MNLLYECAKKYEKLKRYNYIFHLDCDLSFMVAFKPSNFYHLMGLNKLTDITQLSGTNPNLVYRNILKRFITQDTILKSKHYHKINDRLNKFVDIDNIMCSKVIVDFDYSKTDGASSKIKAKYILFKEYPETNIHLCFKPDNTSDYYIPETFIVQNDKYYIKNQVTYNVKKVEEVRYKNKEL